MKKLPKTKVIPNTRSVFHAFLAVKNGTDPKPEKPIRSAIKFATKALKIPYLYVNYSESYEQKTVYSIFHSFLCDERQVLPIWCLRSFCSPEIGDGSYSKIFGKKSLVS